MLYEYDNKGKFLQQYDNIEDYQEKKNYKVKDLGRYLLDEQENITFNKKIGRDLARKFLVMHKANKDIFKEVTEDNQKNNPFVVIDMTGKTVGEFESIKDCTNRTNFSSVYTHSKLNHSINSISSGKKFSNLNTSDGYVFVLKEMLNQIQIINLMTI